MSLIGLFIKVIKLLLCYMSAIKGSIKLTLHFRTRPLRITKESDKLGNRATIKPFGDVIHGRACCAINLIPQAKVVGKSPFAAGREHISGKVIG